MSVERRDSTVIFPLFRDFTDFYGVIFLQP